MRVAIGADHAGFELKEQLKHVLDDLHVEYVDVGTRSTDSVDYPDFAAAVAHGVAERSVDRGVLVCGSGIGMAIAANKVDGVRAASVTEEIAARLCRQHNDANIIALGARLTPIDRAASILRTFLQTPFEGGRHERRVAKIHAIEQQNDRNHQTR